jgi:23S rRNA C2498 (ribose-2'-O)-methylase RlmM
VASSTEPTPAADAAEGLLAYCRAGFEPELAAEMVERAALADLHGHARTEDVESLTEFDEGPLPADWVGELERRGIAVRRDILRDASREVLADYGRNGPSY